MARYRGAVCRLCRREEINYFLRAKDATQENVQWIVDHLLQGNMDEEEQKYQSKDYSYVKNKKQSVYMVFQKLNSLTITWRQSVVTVLPVITY